MLFLLLGTFVIVTSDFVESGAFRSADVSSNGAPQRVSQKDYGHDFYRLCGRPVSVFLSPEISRY